jgi:DNA replication and repair protein RecF
LTWVRHLEVCRLRNVRETAIEFGPGLNVLLGANAQGKTSVLEAVGLLARARSFRSDDLTTVVARGCTSLSVSGLTVNGEHEARLDIEWGHGRRRLAVAGSDVAPRDYHGRLEALVYSTERLRVVRGTPRDRRQYLDRSAAALWPAYRHAQREYERALMQRNAALESGQPGLEAWDETFLRLGAHLRSRRARYVRAVAEALERGYRPRDEHYTLELEPHGLELDEGRNHELFTAELANRRRDERRARRTLVGPHRDSVVLRIDGQDAAAHASSGQARSLVLALTLAGLDVYRRERGTAAVALLDDLDSELDEERSASLCREVAARGQALVTTAHPAWVARVQDLGPVFEVATGRVRRAA